MIDAMKRSTKFLLAGGALAAVAIGSGVTFAVAQGGDDNEPPITGDALDQATEAALAHTGGGRVTGTEVGDEESYYEVEVTLDDGTQVDVQLDQSFHVVGDEADGAGEDDGPGDD
jgi:Peptidase propeptide and YPEB domain